MRKILSLTALLFLYIVTSSEGVIAQELDVSGNGAGSINSVVVTSGSVVNLYQTNTTEIVNSINANSNTGGNDINLGAGGSIKTGDATTIIKVTNIANQNSSTINCCAEPTLTPTPKPQPTQAPSITIITTSASTSTSTSSPAIGGSPVVLGLSNTASESQVAQLIRLGFGLVCVIMSLKVLRSVHLA